MDVELAKTQHFEPSGPFWKNNRNYVLPLDMSLSPLYFNCTCDSVSIDWIATKEGRPDLPLKITGRPAATTTRRLRQMHYLISPASGKPFLLSSLSAVAVLWTWRLGTKHTPESAVAVR